MLPWSLDDDNSRSSDFHISPVADIKHTMKRFNVKFIDKSLSGHCRLTHSCQTDLRVFDRKNGINLNNCPNSFRRTFFEAYKNDPELATVDAFLFTHAVGMSEVFMPFNRTQIIVSCTRSEIGRHSKEAFSNWIESIRLMAQHPNNIIAANNEYDRQYTSYFTGIRVELIPSLCDYVHATYNATRKQFLAAPSRDLNPELYKALKQLAGAENIDVVAIRELYPHYKYEDLASHPGIVFFPYQVASTTS